MKPSLIVHPVSFSPSGKTALATAVALARLWGADLHALEVRGRRRSSQEPIVRSITDPDVEPHFAEFVQSVDSGEVKVSAVELSGDVVDAVVEYASRAPADLVVVAAQARSHGPYWRPGAYANDLVRRLSSPLLAVPASGDAAPLSNSEAVADLIVVSRPQRGDHLSMNSSLAAVLHKAAHPVLVVPTTSADPVDVPWENVAFAEPALSR